MIGFQIAARLFTFRPEFTGLHKEVSQRMTTTYPELPLTKEYATVVTQMEQQMQAQTAAQKIKVGEQAPDIALPDPKGKMRKLSDYKRKVVLIDFWASWCGPCRVENPNVVALYKAFHDKGLNIIGVSLDKEASKWKEAIAKDGLLWPQVSNLKHWKL